jgi:hypothetical protein
LIPSFVIARLVRAPHLSFAKWKLGRPHKAGDDKSNNFGFEKSLR